jgi:hypothetical protein
MGRRLAQAVVSGEADSATKGRAVGLLLWDGWDKADALAVCRPPARPAGPDPAPCCPSWEQAVSALTDVELDAVRALSGMCLWLPAEALSVVSGSAPLNRRRGAARLLQAQDWDLESIAAACKVQPRVSAVVAA